MYIYVYFFLDIIEQMVDVFCMSLGISKAETAHKGELFDALRELHDYKHYSWRSIGEVLGVGGLIVRRWHAHRAARLTSDEAKQALLRLQFAHESGKLALLQRRENKKT